MIIKLVYLLRLTFLFASGTIRLFPERSFPCLSRPPDAIPHIRHSVVSIKFLREYSTSTKHERVLFKQSKMRPICLKHFLKQL